MVSTSGVVSMPHPQPCSMTAKMSFRLSMLASLTPRRPCHQSSPVGQNHDIEQNYDSDQDSIISDVTEPFIPSALIKTSLPDRRSPLALISTTAPPSPPDAVLDTSEFHPTAPHLKSATASAASPSILNTPTDPPRLSPCTATRQHESHALTFTAVTTAIAPRHILSSTASAHLAVNSMVPSRTSSLRSKQRPEGPPLHPYLMKNALIDSTASVTSDSHLQFHSPVSHHVGYSKMLVRLQVLFVLPVILNSVSGAIPYLNLQILIFAQGLTTRQSKELLLHPSHLYHASNGVNFSARTLGVTSMGTSLINSFLRKNVQYDLETAAYKGIDPPDQRAINTRILLSKARRYNAIHRKSISFDINVDKNAVKSVLPTQTSDASCKVAHVSLETTAQADRDVHDSDALVHTSNRITSTVSNARVDECQQSPNVLAISPILQPATVESELKPSIDTCTNSPRLRLQHR
ncbi:hypothetical protein BSLG_005763 [Batrachochytrium salamandrivorans]|nr:hypothetical protein BSLG_005763 [Batrachochytrium salamandrivorans]